MQQDKFEVMDKPRYRIALEFTGFKGGPWYWCVRYFDGYAIFNGEKIYRVKPKQL